MLEGAASGTSTATGTLSATSRLSGRCAAKSLVPVARLGFRGTPPSHETDAILFFSAGWDTPPPPTPPVVPAIPAGEARFFITLGEG